jgi:actin-like ATPase involved in cell morphogenesis
VDVRWWALDPIRIKMTGRDTRSSRIVLELAWNPYTGADESLAAQVLASMARRPQLWAPIGSVVLVAPGTGAHPGVEPAVDTAREAWPAATVTVVEETVAALVGAGLDLEPAACVVVHLDALHISVAVVAGRKVVSSGLVVGGAQGLAQAVIGHLRAQHRIDVGVEPAWAVAILGGGLAPSATEPGRGLVHGTMIAEDHTVLTPQQQGSVVVPPAELPAVLAPAYQPVADLIAEVLRDAPPETAGQAAAGGLLLTGEHPPGAEEHLAGLTGLPARGAVQPWSGFEKFRALLDGVDRLLAKE